MELVFLCDLSVSLSIPRKNAEIGKLWEGHGFSRAVSAATSTIRHA